MPNMTSHKDFWTTALEQVCVKAAPQRTPATLTDILLATDPVLGQDLLKNVSVYTNGADLPFQEWIEKNPEDALHLSRDLKTRLLVVADPASSPLCRYRLIYDGRNWNFPEDRIFPERTILLGADGGFCSLHSSAICLRRKLEPLNTKKLKTPLWKLLELQQPFPDPANYREVALALNKVPPDQLPNVVVKFVSFRRGNKAWSNSCFTLANIFSTKDFLVEALPSPNYGLTFRLKKHRAPNKIDKMDSKKKEEMLPPKPEVWQNCRSSCAKIERSGLNLAYDLGLLDRKERKKISEKLGCTAAAFVVQYGEKPDGLDAAHNNRRTPKFLTYIDIM